MPAQDAHDPQQMNHRPGKGHRTADAAPPPVPAAEGAALAAVAEVRPAVVQIPLKDLVAAVEHALARIDELEAATAWATTMTPEERQSSNGRLRPGEAEGFEAVLTVADHYPGFFVALAAVDGGRDDRCFETGPTREALAKRAALGRLVERLDQFSGRFADSMLLLGGVIRQVATPAYDLAEVAARHNQRANELIAPARAFRSRASRTRKQNARRPDAAMQKQIRELRKKAREQLRQEIAALGNTPAGSTTGG